MIKPGEPNLNEFIELYKTIMEKYSWKAMIEDSVKPAEEQHKGRKPKYVRFSLDTRDGCIWCATFAKSPKEDISFRLDDEDEIKKMFEWLDAEDGWCN